MATWCFVRHTQLRIPPAHSVQHASAAGITAVSQRMFTVAPQCMFTVGITTRTLCIAAHVAHTTLGFQLVTTSKPRLRCSTPTVEDISSLLAPASTWTAQNANATLVVAAGLLTALKIFIAGGCCCSGQSLMTWPSLPHL